MLPKYFVLFIAVFIFTLTGCNKHFYHKIYKPKIIDSLIIEKMKDSILRESGESW